MPEETVPCSNCQHPLKVVTTDVERIVRCPQCKNFVKVRARTQKRMEYDCPQPECGAHWSLPVKMRGQLYTCWKCGTEVELPKTAELVIDGVELPEQIDPGGQYEIRISLSNPGTPAVLSDVEIYFENEGNNISEFYTVTYAEDNPAELDEETPIQFVCYVAVDANAPAGITRIYMGISGKDLLAETDIVAEHLAQWQIFQQHIFSIETEHELQEQSGVAFALQIWACLDTGEVDFKYSGPHSICFETSATESPFGIAPSVPEELTINFREGRGTTNKEFILNNSSEAPQIRAYEVTDEGATGTEGSTDIITVSCSQFHSFSVALDSPQTNGCPFQGRNEVMAVDQFGNLISGFEEDVWIRPQSGRGEIGALEYELFQIPSSAFKRGIADLTALSVMYVGEPTDTFPKEETFKVAYQNKEGISNPIAIEKNPIEISIEVKTSNTIEQGSPCQLKVLVQNASSFPLQVQGIAFEVTHNSETYNDFFEILPLEENPETLPPQSESQFEFHMDVSQEVPLVTVDVEAAVFVVELGKQVSGGESTAFQWRIEPGGRTFDTKVKTTSLIAGVPFELEVQALLDGAPDASYIGKRLIHFETNASPSPLLTDPEIPVSKEVKFSRGKAKISGLVLKNAQEQPSIRVVDQSPGGPQGEEIDFMVAPGKVNFFWFHLEGSQINGEAFEGRNQIMAMDSCGNLIPNFAENCDIYPVSNRGKITFKGKESNSIPKKAFQSGIADLRELSIAYYADNKEKLPKTEEFYVVCTDKRGKSNAITIQARPAEVVINRVTLPERIEPGIGEYKVSAELENRGNVIASVLSVLFSFHTKADVSAHYSIEPDPGNSTDLLPYVPILHTFTIKADSQTPTGTTDIEINVAGVEKESSLPLKARKTLQWEVEAKGRKFKIMTENVYQEKAGQSFGLKIETYRESEKDTGLEGQRQLSFHSSASVSNNGEKPIIPDSFLVKFSGGEASIPAQFILVNAAETPMIYVEDKEYNIQGQTEPIAISAGDLGGFQFEIPAEVQNAQAFVDENLITAIDGCGNIKKDFQSDVQIDLENIKGQVKTLGGELVDTLKGKWFKDGKINLTNHKLQVICSPMQRLPQKAVYAIAHQGRTFTSEEFEVRPRPITLTIEQVMAPELVVCGEICEISFEINNSGETPVEITDAKFTCTNRENLDNTYKMTPSKDNPEKILPGNSTFKYDVQLSNNTAIGVTQIDVVLEAMDNVSQKVESESSFRWRVEPAGRVFVVETQNNQEETAGRSFSLSITAYLDDKPDKQFQRSRHICFRTAAKNAPHGQVAQICEELNLEFEDGVATTSAQFCFYNSGEEASIEAWEPYEGGAKGISAPIKTLPGALGEFEFQLEESLENATVFEGKIIAKDDFGNVKHDFCSDIPIGTQSKRGEFFIKEMDLTNVIPGNIFKEGVADLGALGICYQADEGENLPKQETFLITYGDKRGVSSEVSIQPRPAEVAIGNLEFEEKIFQEQTVIPLTFKVTNSGDTTLTVEKVHFLFENDGNDVSDGFSSEGHPNNPISIHKNNTSTFIYRLDVKESAAVGETTLKIQVRTIDTFLKTPVIGEHELQVAVLEKPRNFVIKTENDNVETVGVPFALSIQVYKDDQIDLRYQGEKEIFFSSTATAISGHAPTILEKETITFTRGKGKTSEGFTLTNASERATISAKEPGKANGTSSEVSLKTGGLKSLQILFEPSKDNPYTLKPMDNFQNIMLDKEFLFDDDIKPGVILSGSGGNFYQPLDVVGHGAMGKVYKAIRLNDNLTVAIKTMLFSNLSDINRFLLEGFYLIRFNHPHIVKGYDFRQMCVRENNKVALKFFLVMEYLTGTSVKDILDDSADGILDIPLATKIIFHSGHALAYMWEQKTVHRDVKPENIQLTDDKSVKLIDLGIAKGEGGMEDITLTQKDTIIGSYPYISPERLKTNDVDYRADVYSLGATYYHILTGMPPYLDGYKGRGGRDLLEYLIKIRTKKAPTPPHKLESEIPKDISNEIMTMLHMRHTKRCKDPDEWLGRLEKLHGEYCK